MLLMLLAIALSAVLSIDIASSSSYKGRTYNAPAVHIVRSGNDFVLNGSPVPGTEVQVRPQTLARTVSTSVPPRCNC